MRAVTTFALAMLFALIGVLLFGPAPGVQAMTLARWVHDGQQAAFLAALPTLPPATAAGVLSLSSTNLLLATDADTGAIRWTAALPVEAGNPCNTVAGIYGVALSDTKAIALVVCGTAFVAYDAATGGQLWLSPFAGAIATYETTSVTGDAAGAIPPFLQSQTKPTLGWSYAYAPIPSSTSGNTQPGDPGMAVQIDLVTGAYTTMTVCSQPRRALLGDSATDELIYQCVNEIVAFSAATMTALWTSTSNSTETYNVATGCTLPNSPLFAVVTTSPPNAFATQALSVFNRAAQSWKPLPPLPTSVYTNVLQGSYGLLTGMNVFCSPSSPGTVIVGDENGVFAASFGPQATATTATLLWLDVALPSSYGVPAVAGPFVVYTSGSTVAYASVRVVATGDVVLNVTTAGSNAGSAPAPAGLLFDAIRNRLVGYAYSTEPYSFIADVVVTEGTASPTLSIVTESFDITVQTFVQVDGGLVVSGGGSVARLTEGGRAWNENIPGTELSLHHVINSAVIDGITFALSNTQVLTLDHYGRLLWAVTPPGLTTQNAGISTVGRYVVVGTNDGQFYFFDSSSGASVAVQQGFAANANCSENEPFELQFLRVGSNHTVAWYMTAANTACIATIDQGLNVKVVVLPTTNGTAAVGLLPSMSPTAFVIVDYGGGAVRVDAASGAIAWHVVSSGTPGGAAPTIGIAPTATILYALVPGNENPLVVAIDISAGAQLWTMYTNPNNAAASPVGLVAAGNDVIVTFTDYSVARFKTANRAAPQVVVSWSATTRCAELPTTTSSPLTIYRDIVYYAGGASCAGCLKAYNATTGALVFNTTFGGLGSDTCTITLAQHRAIGFTVCGSVRAVAFDLVSGRQLFTVLAGSTTTLANSLVFEENTLIAYSDENAPSGIWVDPKQLATAYQLPCETSHSSRQSL